MPRWARFLSCSFTGSFLSLVGFFVAVYWFEGSSLYWRSLIDFAGTPEFWYLCGLFALLTAGALLLARLLVRLYALADAVGGLVAGAAAALAYALFLGAMHAPDWGGWVGVMHKGWPAALIFAAPFALAGGVTAWLWDRLG